MSFKSPLITIRIHLSASQLTYCSFPHKSFECLVRKASTELLNEKRISKLDLRWEQQQWCRQWWRKTFDMFTKRLVFGPWLWMFFQSTGPFYNIYQSSSTWRARECFYLFCDHRRNHNVIIRKGANLVFYFGLGQSICHIEFLGTVFCLHNRSKLPPGWVKWNMIPTTFELLSAVIRLIDQTRQKEDARRLALIVNYNLIEPLKVFEIKGKNEFALVNTSLIST